MADCWQGQASAVGPQWIYQDMQSDEQQTAANELAFAFPRMPPSRIMKPRSADNSPRSAGRRRTTVAHGSMQYSQRQSQAYRTPIDAALLAPALQQRTRPISWHPTSSRHIGYSNMIRATYPPLGNGMTEMPSTESFSAASAHGLVNPLSYPTQGESISNTYFSPDQLCGPTPESQAPHFQQMDSSQIGPVTWDINMPGVSCAPQNHPQEWSCDGMSMGSGMAISHLADFGHESIQSSDDFTVPPTPDILPIQQFPGDSESHSGLPLKSKSPGDELVGMGLYDEPETLLFERSMFGGFNDCQEMRGKGLKLEETFNPSSDDDEENAESENEDDAEQEKKTEEVGIREMEAQHTGSERDAYDYSVNAAVNMLNKSFLFDEPEDMGAAMSQCQLMMGFSGVPCSNLGYGWI